jgi:hypothetical protein
MGWALTFVFDIEIGVSEHQAKVDSPEKGCAAFTHRDGRIGSLNGQQIEIPPQVERSAG